MLSKEHLFCIDRSDLRRPSSVGKRPPDEAGEKSARAAAVLYFEGLKTGLEMLLLGFSTAALSNGMAPTCLYGSEEVEADEDSEPRPGRNV